MQSLSVSEIQRNLKHINDFDILEVVDEKRNIVKGYFLGSRYKGLVEELLDKRKANRKNLLGLVGCANGSDANLTARQIRDERLKKYKSTVRPKSPQ